MDIFIKSMHLVNFKGIRDMKMDFKQGDNLVCGDNGTGKTTLFDAFTWLLFGKDSTDRSDGNFNLKTLDRNGLPILRLEHSVTGVLSVDGRDMKLERRYQEVWEKPNGTTEENLKNHKTLFFINDVKQPTKRDYDAKISSIIAENVFKMITSPFYFLRLRPEEQKAMLQDMAGNITDDDVAKLKPEYAEFLAALEGTDIIEKAKEVKARKAACNEELKLIPSKIETAEKLKPADEDWSALDAALADKRQELADIEALMRNDNTAKSAKVYEQRNNILDNINAKKLAIQDRLSALKRQADAIYLNKVREAENAASMAKQGYQRQINQERENMLKREGEVKAMAGKSYTDAVAKVNEIMGAISGKKAAITTLKATLSNINNDIMDARENVSDTEKAIADKNAEISASRAEYNEIYTSSVSFDPEAFICPTCKRPLEADDVDAKRVELEANFNARKAEKLKANRERGLAMKLKLEALQATLIRQKKTLSDKESSQIEISSQIETAEAELSALDVNLVSAKANVPAEPDYQKALASDSEYQQSKKAVESLTEQMNAVVAEPIAKPDYDDIEKADTDLIQLRNELTDLCNQFKAIEEPARSDLFNMPADYEGQKKAIEQEIDTINQRLGKRQLQERAQLEIDTLEKQRDNLNAKVAELEKWEFDCLQFQKAKDAELLKRINSMFQVVSFSFVSSQLNGGEKLTCVCTVNGTPYPDVNNAAKINAGLDIINAICRSQGVHAPIFVDNSESVNEVLHTDSQKILLAVTKDPVLMIR